SGIACAWMAVGAVKPASRTAASSAGARERASKRFKRSPSYAAVSRLQEEHRRAATRPAHGAPRDGRSPLAAGPSAFHGTIDRKRGPRGDRQEAGSGLEGDRIGEGLAGAIGGQCCRV